ncbi:MAG TPA: DUF6526 family protein [Bryobacteraceae bacterium]|jgi:hypothetical protein
MAEQLQQDFSNHVRRVPGFLALALVLLLVFLGALVNLYKSWGDHERLYSAALILVLTGCVFVTAGYARTFALKAQDRGIRAEENLRSYVMTGKLLDSRLTNSQIAALRFASDAEFIDMANQAAEKGTAPVEIKKSIKSWRADWDRV